MFTRMMPSRAMPRSWSGMASRPSGTWFGWVIMVFGMVEVGRFKNGCRWQCLDYNETVLKEKEFSLFRR